MEHLKIWLDKQTKVYVWHDGFRVLALFGMTLLILQAFGIAILGLH